MTLQWWPTDYIDEVSPPGRASPSAWIETIAGNGAQLAAADPVEDGGDGAPGRTLVADETLTFVSREMLGMIAVTIRTDGTWMIGKRDPLEFKLLDTVPAGTNAFWLAGDISGDTLAESMDAFVAAYIELDLPDDPPTEPTEVHVAMACDSDEQPFRLVIDGGKARFDPIAKNSIQ